MRPCSTRGGALLADGWSKKGYGIDDIEIAEGDRLNAAT
jgi:hypothetical protein